MELTQTPGGIWVPGGAAPKRKSAACVTSYGSGRRSTTVRVHNMSYYREDGMVCWDDTRTGRHGSMFPDQALAVVKDMADKLLGKNVETSICYDTDERNNLLEALRALETIAKEAMPDAPSRSMLEGLLE